MHLHDPGRDFRPLLPKRHGHLLSYAELWQDLLADQHELAVTVLAPLKPA
jgi:hypothetical protein